MNRAGEIRIKVIGGYWLGFPTQFEALEHEVNAWLREDPQREVIDIKYACGYSYDDGDHCSAMIIYRNR